MTPEQLEAHRVRFEQRFYEINGFEPARLNASYIERLASIGWEAYQWALADVDPAQRAEQPPQQSAQPVAWMHETPGRVDVIHDEVKKLLSAVATDYLYRPIDKSEKYTIPLYAAAQPVEVQRVPLTDATQFEKDVARWMEKDGLTREQAECEVNYRTTRKALKSGLSAHGIKPTSSEGGA